MNRIKITVYVAVALTVAATICGATTVKPCSENHVDADVIPQLPDKIGEVAGFQIMGLFLARGGFGCPQQVIDNLVAMNTAYLQNEYLPRYREAAGIYAWLDANHLIATDIEPGVVCPVCGFSHTAAEFKTLTLGKVARRNEISSEIDVIWVNLADQAWWSIPQASQDAYLAWIAAINQ